MANITLTIPDDQINRVITAICFRGGYQEILPSDGVNLPRPNPETKAQFTKRMVMENLKNIVVQYEKELAVKSLPTIISPTIT